MSCTETPHVRVARRGPADCELGRAELVVAVDVRREAALRERVLDLRRPESSSVFQSLPRTENSIG